MTLKKAQKDEFFGLRDFYRLDKIIIQLNMYTAECCAKVKLLVSGTILSNVDVFDIMMTRIWHKIC